MNNKNEYFDSTNIVVDETMATNGLIAQVQNMYSGIIANSDNPNSLLDLESIRNVLKKIAYSWGFKSINETPMHGYVHCYNECTDIEFYLLRIELKGCHIDIGITYTCAIDKDANTYITIKSFAREEL